MSAPAATPESIATRTASIEEGIARIAAAAESFAETSRKNLGDTSKDWETKEAQNGLAVEIKKLLLAAQGPLGAMFDQVQVVSSSQASPSNSAPCL